MRRRARGSACGAAGRCASAERARCARADRARRALARHGRSVAVRCRQPQPAARRRPARSRRSRARRCSTRFLMGTDSLRPRHLQPRDLRRARVADRRHRSRALRRARLRHRARPGCAGYLRWLDGILMRVMDGLMAIPAILLAIALVALWRGSLADGDRRDRVPEIPRVVRLVRSLVLSIREEPYVEAAIALGTPTWKIMFGHILPNTIAPLIVQGTYICASAHPDRGDPVVPRRRPAAGDPDLGQHHGRGPRAVQRLPAQRPLPRHLPRGHGARGQHARRRPARHARPQDGKRLAYERSGPRGAAS